MEFTADLTFGEPQEFSLGTAGTIQDAVSYFGEHPPFISSAASVFQKEAHAEVRALFWRVRQHKRAGPGWISIYLGAGRRQARSIDDTEPVNG